MRTIMSFLVVSSCFLNNLVLNQSIPTQAEQADLLANVQEVFEHVKLLTKDIADSTEKSVVKDVENTVTRAEYILELLEQITLSRLSCDGNSVCMLEARPVISQLAADGRRALQLCPQTAATEAAASCDRLGNATAAAVHEGQLLLDHLGDCSRRGGLGVVTCYRGVIATEVGPVKGALVGAIGAHRRAHEEAVEVRGSAEGCVDEIVRRYRGLLEGVLEGALRCA